MTVNEKKSQIQQAVLDAVTGKQLAGAAVSMGVGKTLIGIRDMDRILAGGSRVKPEQAEDKFFLVVAPTTAIIESWKEELNKWGFDYLLAHIEFTTYKSLNKFLDRKHYHKVYLDECHSLKESHRVQLDFHVARRGGVLGLTGTEPASKNSEKGKLVARFCPIQIDYTTDEAVLAGLLNDYKIVVHYLTLSKDRTLRVEFKNGGGKTSSEYAEYWGWSARILAKEEGGSTEKLPIDTLRILRMQAVMKFTTKASYMKRLAEQFDEKVLLFTCNTDQAEAQSEYTHHSENSSAANKKVLEQFGKGEIDRLACVNQLSMGVNIPNLRTIIIWHAFGNEHRASQKIGRALRLNPTETSTVHILCYKDTIDETWVKKALAKFDPEKIIHLDAQF